MGLCQVAVHLAAVTDSVRVVIDRALYLPQDWAADEERREAAGVPKEVMFATKLQQTAAMVEDSLGLGLRAHWFAGDEVYRGRGLRRRLQELGAGLHGRRVPHVHGHRRSGPPVDSPADDQQGAAAPVDAHADRPGDEGHPRVRLGLARCPCGRHPDGHTDGVSVLVARRHRYTGEISVAP